MKALLNWIDDRSGIAKLTREALFESIPGGARWRYVWGSTLTFAIFVQFITGVMLWMFYSPSATTAWESVYYIQNEVTGGDWLRGIHHWTAQVMIILLTLHLVQVVIDGAYKAPREFNYWFGLALLAITLALGLTGYLLPWDQKGFWATEVATNIVASTPVVGDQLKQLVVGGSDYGHLTLTRFFALHAGVLPAMLVGLIVLHIYLFRKHGITPAAPKTPASTRHFWWMVFVVMLFAQAMLVWNWAFVPLVIRISLLAVFVLSIFRLIHLQANRERIEEEDSVKPRRGDAYFWPDQVLRDAIACAAVLGAVLFFVWQFGTELSSPADPSENYSAARPDWYFMALFQLLKLPGIDIVTGAFIIPGAIALGVFLMPFVGRWKVGHVLNLMFLAVLLIAFVVGTLAGYRHDWSDENHALAVAAAHRDAERIQVLARAPAGLPPAGALSLLREDPYTQGPKLFAANCASCHAYDGHDGTGRPRKDPQIAADLHGFADREWAAAMLNPAKFSHVDYFGGTNLIEDSEMLEFLREELTGLDERDREDLQKVVLALSAEARLKSQAALDAADAEAIEEGKELMGDLGFACTDCHRFYDEGAGGPDLTGYGSREWQIEFIKNPEHKRFYGRDNDNMPIYGPKLDRRGRVERPELMSDKDIGFIVDWLRGDYYEEAPEESPADEPADEPADAGSGSEEPSAGEAE
ncbi:MAG: c-type cytochrome [Akkermansiaceae bacterium]|nr:c-type cytochrome [Akkermansiaceae bacterium]